MQNYDASERFPVRKNPRLRHYCYSTPNYYFVTICTYGKAYLFGNAVQLNSRGEIAKQGIEQIGQHFRNVTVDKYVVMPNHIHMIVILQGNDIDLSTVVGQFKAYVTRKIHATEPERRIWQASYHDHVIRDQKGYEKIWLYIEGNPANWQKDCFYKRAE